MSSEMSCGHTRELAPELALGIADGEERARALEHLAGCPDCRRYLDELSAISDELLLLAPYAEPPNGFESRVAAAISPPRRATTRWRRPLTLAATALTSVAVAVVAMLAIFHDDRELASDYRQTLTEANGSYFDASDLRAPGGREVGDVFRYDGSPSFVVVTVDAPGANLSDGIYDCQFIDADGNTTSFGKLRLDGGAGSYGRATDTELDDVREVRLIGPDKGDVIQASLAEE